MIRVGFIGAVSKQWMGGLNYFKNLLFALSTFQKNELEIFVFVGVNTDEDIKAMFKKYATVVEDSVFDKKSIKWIFSKIESKFFKTNYILKRVFNKYGIKILSHASIENLGAIKTINWIPDFQHIHLPKMFSSNEIQARNNDFVRLVKGSNRIVLSSYDALNDFNNFMPDYISKASVLQFVSQPDKKYFYLTEKDEENIREKYDLKKEFFYMPNQFWKHKNHMLVFEAVKILHNECEDICVVCSGHLEDYRNKSHIESIRCFIKENELESNVRLLGLVDYEDVFSLIKYSKAVINPSLFEGWSSTVEECKSVNKNMILSNLNVHVEQYAHADFFVKDDLQSLVDVLRNYQPKADVEFDGLDIRTEIYAKSYLKIVKSL